MSTYGLEDRLCETGILYKKDNRIDYNSVDEKMNRLREESIAFFRKGLNLGATHSGEK